jgi:hypothetical protein
LRISISSVPCSRSALSLDVMVFSPRKTGRDDTTLFPRLSKEGGRQKTEVRSQNGRRRNTVERIKPSEFILTSDF